METKKIFEILTKELKMQGKEGGKNYFFKCPFHEDKTPSFALKKEDGFLKCFSCNFKTNNFLIFWSKYKGKNIKDSAWDLVELGYIKEPIIFEKKIDSLSEILTIASEIYQRNLITENANKQLSYIINERLLNYKLIEKFKIGCTIGNNQLSSLFFSKKSNYSVENLAETNLFHIPDNKEKGVDFFQSNQIIFPINDENGKIALFAARNIEKNIEPKYIILPNNKKFQKSSLIYNYSSAKESNSDYYYLVEGFFDVISMEKFGLNNSISILGTSISNAQLKLIKKLNKKIILFFDGDLAGIEASIKIAIILISNNIECEIIEEKGGRDPDEICRDGKISLNKVLRNARNPLTFIVRYYFKKMNIEENPHRSAKFITKISEIFKELQQNFQIFAIRKLSLITGMAIEQVEEIYSPLKSIRIDNFKIEDKKELQTIENALIYYSCQDYKFWKLIEDKNISLGAKSEELRKIIRDFYANNPDAKKYLDFVKRSEFLEIAILEESNSEKMKWLKRFLSYEEKKKSFQK